MSDCVPDEYRQRLANDLVRLERLPPGWKRVRLKYLCRQITDGSHFSPPTQAEGLPYVTVRDIVSGQVETAGAEKIDPADFRRLARAGCRPRCGDLLFSKDGTLGKLALVQHDQFVVLSSLAIIRPKNSLLSAAYLKYFFESPHGRQQMESHLAGTALQRITLDSLAEFRVCLPSRRGQQAVVAFLDRQSARIDRLIDKQRQLIALLQQKRHAAIAEVVSKGLDPAAPMKAGAGGWIRALPAHWGLSRVGWVCEVGSGCTPGRDTGRYWNGGCCPWLDSSAVGEERIRQASQSVSEAALAECALARVPAGSVLMAITGEGRARGTAAFLELEAAISQHLAFLCPNTERLDAEYLLLWLQSRYEDIRLESAGWGSTKPAITCSDIRGYPLPLPPETEQHEIVTYATSLKRQFDALTTSVTEQIALLQERRAALIGAAVTGKVDVHRDPPAPAGGQSRE